MNRRTVLLAGMVSALATSAKAQQANFDQVAADAPVSTRDELIYLLTALDTLIFVMAVVVLKEAEAVSRSRAEFQPYGAQLAAPNAVEILNQALSSDTGRALVKEAQPLITLATKELTELLGEVSTPLRSALTKAFSRASTLLAARSADNKGWWCHCYALRKIHCG